MSLKIFHLIFIVISILFTVLFAVYAFSLGDETLGDAAAGWGIVSAVLAVLLGVYGVFFLRKSKKIH